MSRRRSYHHCDRNLVRKSLRLIVSMRLEHFQERSRKRDHLHEESAGSTASAHRADFVVETPREVCYMVCYLENDVQNVEQSL